MKFTFTKTFRHSFLAASTFASVVAIAPAATDAAERAERSERRLETRYLTTLIDDHTLALQLAELAQTQATHEELKQLGAQTETALTAELTQLSGWLQTWYGETHEPDLNRKAERLVRQLSQLSGEAFETELIATLVEHHLDALREAVRALEHVQRPELIDQAALSVAAHADDVAQLRLWLEQWYGDGADEADDETNGTNGASTGVDVSVGGDVGASVGVGSNSSPSSGNNDDMARSELVDRLRGLSGRIGG